jgi:DNA-binding beta-propeller fold protein YncE
MNEHTAPSGSKASLLVRLVRFLLKALGTFVALIVLAVVVFNIYLSTRPAPTTVRPAGIITVPAPFRVGRPFIDYVTIDGQRLYAAYSSAGLVGMIDTTTGKPVGTVADFGRPHGVAVVADRNLGFASDSGDNTIGVFDLNTQRLLQKIPAGIDPDAIIYDQKLNLVYAGNHDGKTAMFIDVATLKAAANIQLGGEPEYPQADPTTGIIYQNLEDTSELVVVDPQKQAVTQRYKLAPCEGPTGLALDAANHRLFSACRSKHLVVLNSDTGEIVAVVPIGAGVDGAGYDPVLRRVYTANAVGSMTVIQQDSADKYRVLENAPTHFGGHSLVIDPVTHRIYVAYFGSIAMYDALPQP